jgi:predicted DNA-binding transcriptional regulator YafY
VRFHCGITHELIRWVLSYGREVIVEQPEHLKQSVVEKARQVVAAYDAEHMHVMAQALSDNE